MRDTALPLVVDLHGFEVLVHGAPLHRERAELHDVDGYVQKVIQGKAENSLLLSGKIQSEL